VLFRLFPGVRGAGLHEAGGPLFVPRFDQGEGRHDNPDDYGALYLSRTRASPVAEFLREYRGQGLPPRLLEHEGAPLTLASLDDAGLQGLIDLDEPRNLATRRLRPSRVATRERGHTQPIGLSIYREGAPGFEWWSTIEASWINVTLFAERAAELLALAAEPEPLTIEHPAVREAAEAVGVLLG
jgi:hypothetical protein